MDKQSINGIWFSSTKEGSTDRRYYDDEPWAHYVNWNKPGTKGYVVLIPLIGNV